MNKTQELVSTLCSYSTQIQRCDGFDDILEYHYHLLTTMYEKNSLFYKTVLKESRIYIIMTLLCFYYTRGETSQAEVKEYCTSMRFASGNSIDSMMFFLRVSGRMNAERNEKNKRVLMVSPTEKGLKEVGNYLLSALLPLNKAYPLLNLSVETVNDKEILSMMYRNMYDLLINRIIINRILPDIHLFTEKDSGHMVILSLYLEALKHSDNGVLRIFEYPYIAVSKTIAVSHTHVRRIVSAAAGAGWMKMHGKSQIEILPEFMQLVREYMGLYFSVCMHALEFDPHKHSTPDTPAL